MKKIYHTHTSSNSYSDSRWYEEDYYLCDTEEYQNKLAECKEEQERVKKHAETVSPALYQAVLRSYLLSNEKPIHANEYYYGHMWNGKSFDAQGFEVTRYLERSTHHYYYLKPGSVTNEKCSSAVGRDTYYGS